MNANSPWTALRARAAALGSFVGRWLAFATRQPPSHAAPISLRQQMQARRNGPSLPLTIRKAGELGFYALALVMALTLAVSILNVDETRARIERLTILEIADENRTFCEKRGLRAGTQAHTLCTLDLNELRARHERRFLEPLGVF